MENQQIIIIRTSYTEAQKRAIKKYKETHKEKMLEIYKKNYEKSKLNEEYTKKHRDQARQRYQNKKDDPEFMALLRARGKEYYQKRKIEKKNKELFDEQINNIKNNQQKDPVLLALIEDYENLKN